MHSLNGFTGTDQILTQFLKAMKAFVIKSKPDKSFVQIVHRKQQRLSSVIDLGPVFSVKTFLFFSYINVLYTVTQPTLHFGCRVVALQHRCTGSRQGGLRRIYSLYSGLLGWNTVRWLSTVQQEQVSTGRIYPS